MCTLASDLLPGYPAMLSDIGIANILEDVSVRLHFERDIFAHSSE
jgi:hypothetical protein